MSFIQFRGSRTNNGTNYTINKNYSNHPENIIEPKLPYRDDCSVLFAFNIMVYCLEVEINSASLISVTLDEM